MKKRRLWLMGACVVAWSLVTSIAVAQPQGGDPGTPAAPPTGAIRLLHPAETQALCRGRLIQGELLGLEADYLKTLDQLRNTDQIKALDACKTAADELMAHVWQHDVTAQGLCNVQQGAQLGTALAARTLHLKRKLEGAETSAQDARDLNACREAVNKIDRHMQAWLAAVHTECPLLAPACGEDANDPAVRRAAERVCGAYRSGAAPPLDASEQVAECLDQGGATAASPPGAGRDLGMRAPFEDSEMEAGERALPGAALQTAILRGAAEFLVERAEQELSLFAAEVVGRRLCQDDGPGRRWLPRTCALLLPRTGAGLAPTAAAIREAARSDLDRLPEALASELASKDKTLACTAAIAATFSREAMAGIELIELVSDLQPVLSKSFVTRSCEGTRVLEAVRQVARGVADAREKAGSRLATFVRAGEHDLLVRRSRGLTAGAPLGDVSGAAKEVLRRARELDAAVRRHGRQPDAATRAAVVVAGLRTIQPFLAHAARAAKRKELVDDIDVLIEITTRVGNREYVAALTRAGDLTSLRAFSSAEARNLVAFGATLAQAESSEAVRTTFEDAAMPLGSWRRKNEPRFGITLTGLVGIHPAYEWVVEDLARDQSVDGGLSLAPTLMVGVDLHQGLGWGRLGLMFSVLDLGALASIRADDPDAENGSGGDADAEPDVRIEQVAAPGVYPYLGWGPADFAVGASFVPSLRPGQTATGDDKALNVVRIGGIVSVDISVLPLL